MTDPPTPEINQAFDDARDAEREERDDSIDDELNQTDRIVETLEKNEAKRGK